MNRIDRLNAIMIQLQSKPKVTLVEIEERFGLSRRTVFRDIRALLEAGVPIGGDAGEGYFVVDGYHLPPVVFNKEEAAAILLGAKFIEHNADAGTTATFRDALTKVKAVLRYADREYLDNLEKNITIIASPRNMKEDFPDSHLSAIQDAIAAHETIEISYYSSYSDETTRREVKPLGLVYYSSRWHLIGYCLLREDLRDFRTDRIVRLESTENTFDPSDHEGYMDFLSDMLTGTDAREATVRFSRKAARFAADQRYAHGFVEEKNLGEWVEMKFVTPSYDFLGRWLMMYGREICIVEPTALKTLITELSKELVEHHSQK